MGLFGEAAKTKRMKFLAYSNMAAHGNEEAGKYAVKLLKDLER